MIDESTLDVTVEARIKGPTSTTEEWPEKIASKILARGPWKL
jgi:hypothetical protein